MGCDSQLLEMVGARHPSCGFAGGLDGGKKKSDQDANNGDDDKKFYQGKAFKAFITPPPRVFPNLTQLIAFLNSKIVFLIFFGLSVEKFMMRAMNTIRFSERCKAKRKQMLRLR